MPGASRIAGSRPRALARSRPASPAGGAPRARRHAASPWRSRPSRQIRPERRTAPRRPARRYRDERVVRPIELLAAGEIGDTIVAVARADRQDVGVISRRAAGVGEFVADRDHRQHVVRPQGVDHGLEGRGEAPQAERHAHDPDALGYDPVHAGENAIDHLPAFDHYRAGDLGVRRHPEGAHLPARPAMVPAVWVPCSPLSCGFAFGTLSPIMSNSAKFLIAP